jgi:glycosyltransferase involved in cell wall biosynthesis
MPTKLSIIIPVFNEERIIASSLPAIFSLAINKEVVVINDGSTDNTLKILEDLKLHHEFKLINQEINSGKGAAIRAGLTQMSGDYFIICDADLEYSPNDIVFLFNEIEKLLSEDSNKKIALYGSRFLASTSWSFHYLINTFLTKLTNLFFGSRLTDMETCFKLIPSSALQEITLTSNGFEIEPEITAKLLKKNYQIIERPISYDRRGYQDGKKIKAKDGFLAIKKLIRERFI